MAAPAHRRHREVRALKLKQWLPEWEHVEFEATSHRRRPDDHFFLFSLPASDLKALTGIYRRSTESGLLRSKDLGIQRRLDEGRIEEIREFVYYGYPWSELSKAKRESGKFDDLRKPGWLSTAIVVNILTETDTRRGQTVDKNDLISIVESDGDEDLVTIRLPGQFSGAHWKPKELPPIEVIDGQHRLWAFEGREIDGNFQLPVVAFQGLDVSWQAYLFWTINIRPKRINPSLAFDLYPLLRTEDWLEKYEGHSIYRETRAQELTEILWSHPESPWFHRINMLGDPGMRMVTQAAWIRSLTATYVKSSAGKGVSIGGLFGAPVGEDREALPWPRSQQAAFLILVWRKVADAVSRCKAEWASILRRTGRTGEPGADPAFTGPHTLLNTDPGVRGVLYITNDFCYVSATSLNLEDWVVGDAGQTDEESVRRAMRSLEKQPAADYLEDLAQSLVAYDWRTSTAEGLNEEERTAKLVFRGSGGYRELRRQLLRLLSAKKGSIGQTASTILDRLGY